MEPEHRKLYIELCQSPPVDLLCVSETLPNVPKFRTPSELLRRRSLVFHELLQPSSNNNEGIILPIELTKTSIETVEDFFIWSLSPEPRINTHASFTDVVRLGIFAWRYQLHALSNQALDVIRENLAEGVWQLQADLVDEVYATTVASPGGISVSQLRELMRSALNQLPRSIVEDGERNRNEWKAAFLKHAQLGWDYIEASGKEWSRERFLEGVCRFHVHEHQGSRKVDVVKDGECPFRKHECYPLAQEIPALNELELAKAQTGKTAEEASGERLDSKAFVLVNMTEEHTAPEIASDEVSISVASPLPEPVLSGKNGTQYSGRLSEESYHTAGSPINDSVKNVHKAPRSMVDDEVNGSLTWDNVTDKANSTRTIASREVNGRTEKIAGEPELQVKLSKDAPMSPESVPSDDFVVANGIVNGSDAAKTTMVTPLENKVSEVLNDKNVDENGIKFGKKGKKKRNSMNKP